MHAGRDTYIAGYDLDQASGLCTLRFGLDIHRRSFQLKPQQLTYVLEYIYCSFTHH
jgi:hypothetical protein